MLRRVTKSPGCPLIQIHAKISWVPLRPIPPQSFAGIQVFPVILLTNHHVRVQPTEIIRGIQVQWLHRLGKDQLRKGQISEQNNEGPPSPAAAVCSVFFTEKQKKKTQRRLGWRGGGSVTYLFWMSLNWIPIWWKIHKQLAVSMVTLYLCPGFQWCSILTAEFQVLNMKHVKSGGQHYRGVWAGHRLQQVLCQEHPMIVKGGKSDSKSGEKIL